MIRLALLMIPAVAAGQAIPPGFVLEKVADAEGFVTSLAPAPDGSMSYSSRTGEVYLLKDGESILLGVFETASVGNQALLGIAWRDAESVVGHYNSPDQTADLLGALDVDSGEVSVLARLECDEGRVCPSEHHGGNVVVGGDGAIYFAIGDYGGGMPAQLDSSPGGKIWRVTRDGTLEEFARGFRNPYDLAWLGEDLLLVSDNGPIGEDEMNIVRKGDNAGWPYTVGTKERVSGTIPPAYTFPETTAPTGLTLVSGGPFRGGFLSTTFVTRSLTFFPAPLSSPLREPVTLLVGDGPLMDVAQAPDGTIWVATATAIHRLVMPRPGDADGDGVLTEGDVQAIAFEILDGDGASVHDVQGGSVLTGWGADANQDGTVDARDLVTLSRIRRGPVRGAPSPSD